MPIPERTGMTRRGFFEKVAKTGVVLGAGYLVAACSSATGPDKGPKTRDRLILDINAINTIVANWGFQALTTYSTGNFTPTALSYDKDPRYQNVNPTKRTIHFGIDYSPIVMAHRNARINSAQFPTYGLAITIPFDSFNAIVKNPTPEQQKGRNLTYHQRKLLSTKITSLEVSRSKNNLDPEPQSASLTLVDNYWLYNEFTNPGGYLATVADLIKFQRLKNNVLGIMNPN